MVYDLEAHRVSFLVGDIIRGRLKKNQPLPTLTCEENEELRKNLLWEIGCLREFGELEGGTKEQRLVRRVQESLDNDDKLMGQQPLSTTGPKDKVRPRNSVPVSDTTTKIVLKDATGIVLSLRVPNLTDENLLRMLEIVLEQIRARDIILPEQLDHQIPLCSPWYSSQSSNPRFTSRFAKKLGLQTPPDPTPSIASQSTIENENAVVPEPRIKEPQPEKKEIPPPIDIETVSPQKSLPASRDFTSKTSLFKKLLLAITIGILVQNWAINNDLYFDMDDKYDLKTDSVLSIGLCFAGSFLVFLWGLFCRALEGVKNEFFWVVDA
jgi:hypothetical protein